MFMVINLSQCDDGVARLHQRSRAGHRAHNLADSLQVVVGLAAGLIETGAE